MGTHTIPQAPVVDRREERTGQTAGDQIGDGAILPHTAGDDGIQALRMEQVFDIVSLID